MKNRQAILCMLLVVAAFAGTAWMLPQLPPHVAVHWDMHGNVDRMGDRIELFLIPVLMAGLLALWHWLPILSPRRYGIERFGPVWWFACVAIQALQVYVQVLLLGVASGAHVDLRRALPAGLALLFVVLGNVMGKVKPNFWLGIRTPWTLASERVWYATHRLAAKSMTFAGVAGLVLVACNLPMAVTGVLAAGVLWPAVWSCIYSRRLDQAGPAKH